MATQATVTPAETFAFLQRQVDQLYGVYEAQAKVVQNTRQSAEEATTQVQLLQLTEAALATLLGQVSQQSLASLEQTITYGLQTVFDDHLLVFRFKVSQQRGGQVLEPVLVRNEVEAHVLEAYGGGPANVVAFLLRLLVCHRLGLYPVLLLDESFAYVSRQYVPNVAKLLRELAESLGFTFLLVTHQPDFLQHADRAYEVVEGTDGTSFREARHHETE